MRWVFIGAGNMASSLIGGLLAGGGNVQDIAVVDPNPDACGKARERFGIRAATSLEALASKEVQDCTTPQGFVLSVKPDIVEPACKALSASLSQQTNNPNSNEPPLVVSVAAGVRASSMTPWLPENTPIVRCMPNTPALLGLGATALFANTRCNDTHKQLSQDLLDTAGSTLWVNNESELDAVTALSGSGPAYFFFLIEHMAKAGVELGLDEQTARDLAIDTAFGAASMAKQRDLTPSVLRENVTSKGGTTAAALQVFTDQHMPAIVKQAMQAAHDRAVELGDEFSPA